MPLNKLQNFIKNTDGRILYVNPNDLDSSDSITNTGNSLAQPFKTIQRALLESARFSYISGSGNDLVEKTTILVFPAEHVIDNRPGYAIYDNNGIAYSVPPSGGVGSPALSTLSLELDSVFDLSQEDNILYKFNSINGGVIIPRGTSIVGLDLRKTKIRPKYVPNPTDPFAQKSSIFRVTGACYFWQFSFFDGDDSDLVYTHPTFFSSAYKSTPRFSHHKLSCFEYADGVNIDSRYNLTDLDMYYSKLSNAFNTFREIPSSEKFPNSLTSFAKRDPEWQIVGAFATDPVAIESIFSGNGITASNLITVRTSIAHDLNVGTPIKIRGVGVQNYNVSTSVQSVIDDFTFTYLLPSYPINLNASPSSSGSTVTVETDTVSGASPYIFNCSLRSVWGMNGMHADGSKASGFRSMVVAQFTAVSLQKDDRAFVKYDPVSRSYEGVNFTTVYGASLPLEASQTDTGKIYHLDQSAIYRNGWETSHIKVSNDAFIQIVSVFAIGFNKHFDIQSGGDASITNSNSNFGQISLSSEGFKSEAFDKDDKGFITSVIPPREVDVNVEEDIEWLSIDVTKTVSVADPTRLYLYGFTLVDDVPSHISQGYRIGARNDDKLYVKLNGSELNASIYMDDGSSSSKVYTVGNVNSASVLSIGAHNLSTGEKIIINSSIGDLPENVTPHIVYYAIRINANKIKLATSFTNALNEESLDISGGSSLVVYSRVSDRISGELGSPIQYDAANENWYINVDSSNTIYPYLVANQSTLDIFTDLAYVKRVVDDRSLDEKLYKLRVVIPKELSGAKDPEEGFILQESGSTGARSGDFTLTTIDSTDYEYKRNQKFIRRTSFDSAETITVETCTKNNLNVGDIVVIRNITDSINVDGDFNIGYNGKFFVTSSSDYEFEYKTTDIFGNVHVVGLESTNDINLRSTPSEIGLLPRYERSDLQSNLYIYRNEVISNYIEGSQDGIYHLYLLNASNTITEEFTGLKYSQNTTDLYPQLDRDNFDSNPPASTTFALRSPIGDVVTNDLKRSTTRESIDKFTKSFGLGKEIISVTDSGSSADIKFDRQHEFAGVVEGAIGSSSGFTPGTYYDVKLYSNSGLTVWNGATANVTVAAGGNISSVNIVSSGSDYSVSDVLYFDTSVIGSGNNGTYTITSNGLSRFIGDVVQITGDGNQEDGYYRITSLVSSQKVSIAKTAGDPTPVVGQYALVVGPSSQISSKSYSNNLITITTSTPHGLVSGNKIRLTDSSSNNLGDYLVKDRLSVTQFTVVSQDLSLVNGYVLKHGYSSNQGISDIREENIAARHFTLYGNDALRLSSAINDSVTSNILSISELTTGGGVNNRFPIGTYIQIRDEIMRVVSSANTTQLTVIRGSLGTRKQSHPADSLIKKIKPIAVEFRRPSILRASVHTFEYLGYGPGNYSTSLPQVQFKSLSERESFLVQSQERSGGIVVYTGMNNQGDFFNGNTKTSSSSGQITSYDIPKPTITGDSPSKSSALFDELTVKERLVVEGGESGTVLSQFDGPVTFNKQTRFKDTSIFSKNVRIKDTSSNALDVFGSGIIGGELSVGSNLNIGGDLTINDDKGIFIGNDSDLKIYHNGSNSIIEDSGSGDLRILSNGPNGILIGKGPLASYEPILKAIPDAGIEVYHNNSKKLETTTTGVDIYGNLDLTKSSQSEGRISANYLVAPNINPIGGILLWPGSLSNFPDNWRVCNGALLEIADYTDCYNILTNNGTTFPYGANVGTRFRLPNMTNRFVVGTGSNYTIGQTGGSADAVLVQHSHNGNTSAESEKHTHQGVSGFNNVDHIHQGTTDDDTPDHTHDIPYTANSYYYWWYYRFGNLNNTSGPNSFGTGGASNKHQHPFTTGPNTTKHQHPFITQENSTSHSHSYVTSQEGQNGTGKNLPPYMGMIYLIRIS
jgi:microcystin-dependent protein